MNLSKIISRSWLQALAHFREVQIFSNLWIIFSFWPLLIFLFK